MNKKIYLIIIIILITLFISIISLGFFLPKKFMIFGLNNLIESTQEYNIVKFDINNPKYNFYYKGENSTTIYQLNLQRKYIFFWDIENTNTPLDQITEIVPFGIEETKKQFGNKDIQEVKEIAIKERGKNDFYLQDENSRYYDLIKDVRNNVDDINSFYQLKKGMKWDEVVSIVGKSDRGYGKGGVTNTNGEINYYIGKNNIKFIALGWNNYPQLNQDETLKNVVIVYEDRKAETIIE